MSLDRDVVHKRIITIVALHRSKGGPALPNAQNSSTGEHWDSLSHLSICMAVEQEFGVSIDMAQVEALNSIDPLVDFVLAQINGRSS